MRKVSILLVLILFGSTALVSAGPLVPGHLSADAKWFGHVNFEAIRSLGIVKDWKEKVAGSDRCKEKIAEAIEKIGMNPMEDVLGATLYATAYKGQGGIVLIYVRNADQKKIEAVVQDKCDKVKTDKLGKRTLFGATAKHHGHEMKVVGTFATDGLVVIAFGTEKITTALDVIDGKTAALEKSAPLLKGVSKRALFVSKAIDVPADYRESTKCPVLRQCTDAFAQWTAKGGTISGRYALTADTAEKANDFKTILDGLVAMAALNHEKLPGMKDVLEGLKYNVKDRTLTVTIKITEEQIQKAVKECIKRKMDHHGSKCDKPRGPAQCPIQKQS